MYFTNMGSNPLHKLKVASSNPKFFTLGLHSDKFNFDEVYVQETKLDKNKNSRDSSVIQAKCDTRTLSRVIDIDIPDGTLQPKQTMCVPLWIRGNDIGGIHEVDFLFYYESAQKLDKNR